MKKGYVILIIGIVVLIGAILLGSILFKDRIIDRKKIDNKLPELDESLSLGRLCSGEDECRQFCQNNRGMCEEYCSGNTNELCRIIFSLDVPADGKNYKQEDCVSNPNPVFTHTFADIAKLSEISRYGNNAFFNPGSQARNYVSVKEGESTPVYAPTNVTITRIYFSDKNYTQFFNREYVRPEYRIDFTVSCEVKAAYDHIVSLSDKLKQYAPQVPAPGKNDGVEVSISLGAGEIIGYTSGGFPGRAFDFFFLNYARKAEHLNPSRWNTDHSLYMDCPLDYFPAELKNQYLGLIAEFKNKRDCGPNFREVANTPLGYWFQGDATETQGNRFSISASKHFVEWTLILGDVLPIPYRDSDGGRVDPETITEGKSACYFDSNRNVYAFLKMLPNDTLGVVSGTGKCPLAFPEKYEVWER